MRGIGTARLDGCLGGAAYGTKDGREQVMSYAPSARKSMSSSLATVGSSIVLR
jgi:hypothetical protein